jgi:hypothetical protein
MFSNSVFHLFIPNGKNRRGKSKTIVGEIPTIDFTFFLIFLLCKMGVLNEKRCNTLQIPPIDKTESCFYERNFGLYFILKNIITHNMYDFFMKEHGGRI